MNQWQIEKQQQEAEIRRISALIRMALFGTADINYYVKVSLQFGSLLELPEGKAVANLIMSKADVEPELQKDNNGIFGDLRVIIKEKGLYFEGDSNESPTIR